MLHRSRNHKIEQTIAIHAPMAVVWDVLTNPELMKRWMAEPEMQLEVDTDWKEGSPIAIRGFHHQPFRNVGMVTRFEPERALAYSYLSSLSRLPDEPRNYTHIAFTLSRDNDTTMLTFTATHFPTESIFRHVAFYWAGTLRLLKQFAETAHKSEEP